MANQYEVLGKAPDIKDLQKLLWIKLTFTD